MPMKGSGRRAAAPGSLVVAWLALLPCAEVNRAPVVVVVMRMGRTEGGHDAVVAIAELKTEMLPVVDIFHLRRFKPQ